MDQPILKQIRYGAFRDELQKIAFHINVPEEMDALKGALKSKALSTAVKAPSNLLNSRKQQDGQTKLADIDIGHDQQFRTSRFGGLVGSSVIGGAIAKQLLNEKVNVEEIASKQAPKWLPKFILRMGMKKGGLKPVMTMPSFIKSQFSHIPTKSGKLKFLAKAVLPALGTLAAGTAIGGIAGSLAGRHLETTVIKKDNPGKK